MPQGISLHREIPDTDWLARRVEVGDFRAAARFVTGPYQAVSFSYDSTPDTRSQLMTCVPPDCNPGVPLPIWNLISHQIPAEYIFFAVCTVTNGFRRVVEQHLLDAAPSRKDTWEASAHVFGSCEFNLMIEVMGDDHDVALQRLLELTDHEAIGCVQALQTFPELTFGFGTPAAR